MAELLSPVDSDYSRLVSASKLLILDNIDLYEQARRQELAQLEQDLQQRHLALIKQLEAESAAKLIKDSQALYDYTEEKLAQSLATLEDKIHTIVYAIVEKLGVVDINSQNLLNLIKSQLEQDFKTKSIVVYCNTQLKADIQLKLCDLSTKVTIIEDNSLSLTQVKLETELYLMYFDSEQLINAVSQLLELKSINNNCSW